MKAERLALRLAKVSPVFQGAFEQYVGSEDVRLNEIRGPVDGSIHVGFGGQMHDGLRLVLREHAPHGLSITDIRLDKGVARVVDGRLEGLRICCIG